MKLRHAVLGVALGELAKRVREQGPNYSPEIERYFANLDPPIRLWDTDGDGVKEGYPYCAAFVQFCADRAAEALDAKNPLDAVVQEALVQSYYQFAEKNGLLVASDLVDRGDLVLFGFKTTRTTNPWNHIGIVETPPKSGAAFAAVEANTGPDRRAKSALDPDHERDGDGVHLRRDRTLRGDYKVCFVRYDD